MKNKMSRKQQMAAYRPLGTAAYYEKIRQAKEKVYRDQDEAKREKERNEKASQAAMNLVKDVPEMTPEEKELWSGILGDGALDVPSKEVDHHSADVSKMVRDPCEKCQRSQERLRTELADPGVECICWECCEQFA